MTAIKATVTNILLFEVGEGWGLIEVCGGLDPIEVGKGLDEGLDQVSSAVPSFVVVSLSSVFVPLVVVSSVVFSSVVGSSVVGSFVVVSSFLFTKSLYFCPLLNKY